MRARNAALVLLGIALLVFAFSAQREEIRSEAQPEGAMRLHPPNFTLASLKGGEEALREVMALHRGSTALELEDALIAEYITQDGRLVKVWVGIARDENTAREMAEQMRARLGTSGMFTPAGSLSVAGIEVFKARGMVGQHYYYARKNRVVWISGMLSEEELRTLVESF
jgi:hypothetical protein